MITKLKNSSLIAYFINNTALHYALRIAIACAIACLVYRILDLKVGYWALLTAVITIQANLGASVKRAKDRLLGTFLGVIVGGFLLMMLYNNFVIIYFVALVLIFLTVYYYKTSYAYAIFFGSILLILLIGKSGYASWNFALYRLIDTLVGLVIGLLASYLLWPKNAKVELYSHLSNSIDQLKDYFLYLMKNYHQNVYDYTHLTSQQLKIEETLVGSRQLFKEFTYEPAAMRVTTEAVYSIILNIEIIYDILITIKITLQDSASQLLTIAEKQRITDFVDEVVIILSATSELMKLNSPSTINAQDLIRLTDKIKINLLDEGAVKSALINYNYPRSNLILLTTHMKRLAAELKYIAESIKQLNYL